MDIRVSRNYGACELIVEAENVKIVEDVEHREYSKLENGKIDFSIFPKRDIDSKMLDKISGVLSDLIYYKSSEYDSRGLIKDLFDKLPKESIDKFLDELNAEYRQDDE